MGSQSQPLKLVMLTACTWGKTAKLFIAVELLCIYLLLYLFAVPAPRGSSPWVDADLYPVVAVPICVWRLWAAACSLHTLTKCHSCVHHMRVAKAKGGFNECSRHRGVMPRAEGRLYSRLSVNSLSFSKLKTPRCQPIIFTERVAGVNSLILRRGPQDP